MTRVAALELGRFGIRVNAVCPEAGNAEMMRPYVPKEVDVELAGVVPAARAQDADEAPARRQDRRRRQHDPVPGVGRERVVHGRRLPGRRRQSVGHRIKGAPGA
jgi:NAD(P)-dependent dehydrogenase (short-subunit alcohol dehydrogenase family)